MKMLLTSVLLLVLGSGRVQCQLRLDNSEVSCVRNGDDYRLLDDGRVVRSGESSNVNDVMLKLPVDKWHRGARLLGVFDLDAGQEQAVIGWEDTERPMEAEHYFQVFTGQKGRLAQMLREFT